MFYVGDIVRCEFDRSGFIGSQSGPKIKGLAYWQRFEVTDVMNYRDGSQSLYVRYDPKAISNSKRDKIDRSIRGPFSSVRFILDPENVATRMYQYDPSQLGDLDDGI